MLDSLADAARGLMGAAGPVGVTAGPARFAGTITAVGVDVLRLALPGGQVDVRLLLDDGRPAPVVLRGAPSPGPDRAPAAADASTFRARLAALADSRRPVTVGLAGSAEPVARGALTLAAEHVVVAGADGRQTVVPVGAIAWVRSR